jgi:hypothetical protein
VSRGAGNYNDPYILSAKLNNLAVTGEYISPLSANLTGEIYDESNLTQTLYYQLGGGGDDSWQSYPSTFTPVNSVYNFAGLSELAITGFGEGQQTLRLRTFNGQDYSPVEEVAVILDRSAPSLRAVPETATWTEAISSVNVSVSDPGLPNLVAGSGVSHVRYSWNTNVLADDCLSGGTMTSNGANVASGVVAGTNTLYLCARDEVGNVTNWQGVYYYQTAMAYDDIPDGKVLYFAGRRFVKIEGGYVWQGNDEERLAWDENGAALSFDDSQTQQVAHWLNVAYLVRLQETLTAGSPNGFTLAKILSTSYSIGNEINEEAATWTGKITLPSYSQWRQVGLRQMYFAAITGQSYQTSGHYLANYLWLRNPYSGSAFRTWAASSNGELVHYFPDRQLGVRPAFTLDTTNLIACLGNGSWSEPFELMVGTKCTGFVPASEL